MKLTLLGIGVLFSQVLFPNSSVVLAIESLAESTAHPQEKKEAKGGDKPEESHAHGKEEGNSHAKHSDEKEHEKEEEHGHGHGNGHEEEEKEEGSSRVGPGKAITEASRKKGFKLSEKAVQALRIQLATVQSSRTHRLPFKASVHFQNDSGIYRFREGWFTLVKAELQRVSPTEILVRTDEVRPGDQVVIDGVPLLRVAELEAWGGSGDGHGH